MKIYSKSLPLAQAKEIENFLNEFRTLQRTESDLTTVSEPEDYLFEVKDIDEKSGYFLKIGMPTKNLERRYMYPVDIFPYNHVTLKENRLLLAKDDLIKKFHWWIELIKEHNQISFSEQDQFEKQYEKEIFDDFEIVEDDSDITAFSLPQQLVLDNIFEKTINVLERNKEKLDTEYLIEEAKQIRKQITTSSKKSIWKKISKFYAKIRIKQFGIEVLKQIAIELGKNGAIELFKAIGQALLN